MQNFLKGLIFSNLYVAIPVAALVLQTYLFTNSVDFFVIFLVYFSTLFVYNTHRIRGLNQVLKIDLGERHLWAIKNKNFLVFIIFLAILGAGFSFYKSFSVINFWYLLPPMLITAGYVVPFIPSPKRLLRLRDIPFLKAILISAVVSYVTIVLVYQNLDLAFLLQFLERFFFILAITIPFDIRDYQFDSHSKLKTFPLAFGIKKSKKIAFLSLIFSFLISLFLINYRPLIYLIPLGLSLMISAFIIQKSTKKSSEFFYSFLVEGTMIIQTLLVMMVYFLD